MFAFVRSKGKYKVLAWYGRSFISRQNESCPTGQCPKKFLRYTWSLVSLCDTCFIVLCGPPFWIGEKSNKNSKCTLNAYGLVGLDSFVNCLGRILTFVKLSGFTDLIC